jgi:hypothetical protein
LPLERIVVGTDVECFRNFFQSAAASDEKQNLARGHSNMGSGACKNNKVVAFCLLSIAVGKSGHAAIFCAGVARWQVFEPKIPIWRVLQWNMLVYYMYIWSIFMAIWYIVWPFDIFYCYLVYFRNVV